MTQRFRQETEVRAPLRQKQAIAVTNVTNSNATLYTVPDDRYFELFQLSVANISGANLAVTVYIVPDGGSAANTNKVYDAFVVWPNTSETLWAAAGDKAHSLLEPGDQIVAVTDHATGGNFWGWGETVAGLR